MADPTHPTGAAAAPGQAKDKLAHWQKQANHFKQMITEMTAVLNDPNASEEDRLEAQQTIDDMNKNLTRLQMKHGVSPA